MDTLTSQLLSQACQIFLDIAYPDGVSSIPEPRRPFFAIAPDADVRDYLPPAPIAMGLVNVMTGPNPGYSFRLGCVHFPYLRLTIQQVAVAGEPSWVFGVDTHDSWHHPDHSDAADWLKLQIANRELKSRIEHAWEAAGLLTHNRLLRLELQPSRKS